MRIIIYALLSIFPFASLLAQSKNCIHYPSTAELLKALEEKPLTNLLYNRFSNNCNVDSAVKKRVLQLFYNKWTNKAIDDTISQILIDSKDFYNIDNAVKQIVYNDTAKSNFVKDSITKYWRKYIRDELISYGTFETHENLILTAAQINLIEVKPLLYKALKTNDTLHYNLNTVKLALARMGDKQFQKSIIKQCKLVNVWEGNYVEELNKSIKQLQFINTQESIYAMHNWLDTSYKCITVYKCPSPTQDYSLCTIYCMLLLKEIILNKDFQKLTGDLDVQFTNWQLVLDCKKWLIKNKGKYIISQNTFF